ncbi:MAG: hypothetical protein KKC30_10315 [Proteobacteria bacterium]|nr:hypothetical protein [Pseudomonadota bacterium]MBU4383557.1 hypothetical protein [Pseudomonadota bacterium]MBU4605546.1 hypothetical protein [Pseudomonadota bacterium]MCG2764482.1 hypothetical protein [Desulfarculaceae bacterium]
MMRVAVLTMALLLALGLSACRDQGAAAPQKQPGPSLFVGVYDMPCPQVQTQVGEKLKADPGLGLGGQKRDKDSVSYEIPQRQDGDLRWSAWVTVQCTGPLAGKLSSLVKAQRLVQGVWQPENDTTEIERKILDKITPQP